MKVILMLDCSSEGWVNVKCMAINITRLFTAFALALRLARASC